jgi:NAD(P) transhydrogenase subunit alpha
VTEAGQEVDHKACLISGPTNLAGDVPVNASSLYAKNLLAFLETMIDKKDKTLKVNWDDEIVKARWSPKTAASSTRACRKGVRR